jgi:hypothetical protein
MRCMDTKCILCGECVANNCVCLCGRVCIYDTYGEYAFMSSYCLHVAKLCRCILFYACAHVYAFRRKMSARSFRLVCGLRLETPSAVLLRIWCSVSRIKPVAPMKCRRTARNVGLTGACLFFVMS